MTEISFMLLMKINISKSLNKIQDKIWIKNKN